MAKYMTTAKFGRKEFYAMYEAVVEFETKTKNYIHLDMEPAFVPVDKKRYDSLGQNSSDLLDYLETIVKAALSDEPAEVVVNLNPYDVIVMFRAVCEHRHSNTDQMSCNLQTRTAKLFSSLNKKATRLYDDAARNGKLKER